MKRVKPMVDNTFLLERFQAKGGWTYVIIPGVAPDRSNPFGMYRVRGSIDDFLISAYHLMPLGNGQLFLPVKAEIRKKIGKKEGDQVHVILYPDNEPVTIPEELLVCLQDDEMAHKIFLSYPEGEKKLFIDWIFSAKTEETKVRRIAKTLNKLVQGKKFMDK